MDQTIQYAGFWRRFLASFIDGLIVTFFNFILGVVIGLVLGLTGLTTNSNIYSVVQLIITLISYLVTFSYYIYFIGAKGQTLGKMAMGIKVVKLPDNSVPGYLSAFLREVVGKFLSAIVLLLGFIWMLWDSKKQTWHDKISNTIVIKV